jgi:hypothetical protein
MNRGRQRPFAAIVQTHFEEALARVRIHGLPLHVLRRILRHLGSGAQCGQRRSQGTRRLSRRSLDRGADAGRHAVRRGRALSCRWRLARRTRSGWRWSVCRKIGSALSEQRSYIRSHERMSEWLVIQ